MADAYAIFAFMASICALWAMQKITPDASLSTWLGKVKWCHRAAIALASIVFLYSGADALYWETKPRLSDFLLIFVLMVVLILSVMRHMQAPTLPERSRSRWIDHTAL